MVPRGSQLFAGCHARGEARRAGVLIKDSWNPASFSRGPSKSMFDALIIFIRRVQHYLLALALNFCPRISNCSKVSFVVLRIAY